MEIARNVWAIIVGVCINNIGAIVDKAVQSTNSKVQARDK
jgi:hypothetical protein